LRISPLLLKLDIYLIGNRTIFLSFTAIGTSSCPWLGTRTCTD